MKQKSFLTNSRLVIAVLLMAMTATISCSKDDGGENGTAAEGTIQAKVDGNKVTTAALTTFASKAGGILIIQGNTVRATGTNEAFSIQITAYNGKGTYQIDNNIVPQLVLTTYTLTNANPLNPNPQTWSAPFGSKVNGKITVSEETSTHIKGTFEFEAENSEDKSIKTITEGAFNVKLQ